MSDRPRFDSWTDSRQRDTLHGRPSDGSPDGGRGATVRHDAINALGWIEHTIGNYPGLSILAAVSAGIALGWLVKQR